MRAAARLRNVDATGNHHRRAGEPEQHRDTIAISITIAHRDSVTIAVAHRDRVAIAVAHPETHTDEHPRDTDAAGARSLLRR